MRTLFRSDFFLRFAGGFALGAVAVLGMQPQAFVTNVASWIGTVAHVANRKPS